MRIDATKLTAIESMVGEDDQETEEFHALYAQAAKFLESFRWCAKINTSHFGLGVANIVAVFLFEIVPRSSSVDSFLWVVVGDLPPAYLVTDSAPNAACALNEYIVEMRKWVDAVSTGAPTTDLIPVNVPPTIENARNLELRLEYLSEEILADYQEDLAACQ